MQVKIGDLLAEVKAGIICQSVNAQGKMGSGFAKAVIDRWPQVYDAYIERVGPAYTQKDSGAHLMGDVIPVEIKPDLFVLNIVGQQFFGRDGRRYTSYDALANGFEQVRIFAEETGLSVHYPLIGCGLGGGNWTIVSAIISANLDTINHSLWLQPDMAHMITAGLPE